MTPSLFPRVGSKDTGETPESSPDQRRQALVESTLEHWRKQLGAPDSGRPGRGLPVLDLTAAHPTGLAQLYADRPAKLANLVREPGAYRHALDKAHEVLHHEEKLAQQHGIVTTYLAIGTARWQEADLASAVEEPDGPYDQEQVERSIPRPREDHPILRPVRMRVDAEGDIILSLEPVVEISPVLIAALRRQGYAVDPAALARSAISTHGFSPAAPLAKLTALGREALAGFELRKDLLISQFVHPTQVLVDDLDALHSQLLKNPLVRALAGDDSARAALEKPLPPANPIDRDPDEERGVGDLDPGQQDVLDAVATGASLLLDTPPGSDSTATVAAVLADGVANGKSVAYVTGERRVAQTTVSRLQELGLEELVLDLCTGSGWRSTAAGQLRASMNPPVVDIDTSAVAELRSRLVAARTELAGYTEQLHTPRSPWGISAYDALQVLTDLTALRPGPRTRVRLDSEVLTAISTDSGTQARELLARAAEAGLFSARRAEDAWYGAVINDEDGVDDLVTRVKRISAEALPTVSSYLATVQLQTGLKPAKTLEEWDEQLIMLDGVRDALDVFQPLVFERSAADMVIATASRAWRREHNIAMKWSTRRRLVKQARDMVRPGRHVDDLHAELVRVQEQREIWRRHCEAGGWPRLPDDLSHIREITAQLAADIDKLEPVLGSAHRSLRTIPVPELQAMLTRMAADEEGARALPERVALQKEIHDLGIDELVEDLRRRGVAEALIPAELDLAWWASALGTILVEDRQLGGYDREALKVLSGELADLDQAQTESLAPQVLRKAYQIISSAIARDSDQAAHMFAALAPERGTALREVLSQHPMSDHIRPIRVLAPALVPQVLSTLQRVDLVVLDGVSRTPMAELIPIIGRAKQVVFVGDVRRHWTGTIASAARLLPHRAVPPARERINEFVAMFLAHHGYEGGVLSVPVPRVTSTIRLDVVDGRGMPAPGTGAVESSQTEVDYVVDRVIDHALTTPERSLAVVTLNSRHAQRVREAIIAAVAGSPAVDDFFTRHQREPFVVVDAATTGSQQRDTVILSVGFAKTPHGRVLHDFGEISGPHGPSHLVEALSRVRDDLIVVSSLAPTDIDPSRITQTGAIMLSDLLKVAQDGELLSAAAQDKTAVPDRLLIDLAERLYRFGLTVVPNVGVPGGMRIPLAIGHPDLPDELLVAVLTDDDAFVAEASLRRRERHWVQRLEDYGWTVYTVISTAVFMDPQTEAQTICDLVLAALQERNAQVGDKSEGVAPGESLPGVDPVTKAKTGSTEAKDEAGVEAAVKQEAAPAQQAEVAGKAGEKSAGGAKETDIQAALTAGMAARTGEAEDAADNATGAAVGASAVAGVAATAGVVASEPQSSTAAAGSAEDGEAVETEEAANIPGSSTPVSGTPAVLEAVKTVIPRGPRPPIAQGLPLAAYSDDQLDDLVAWIHTDQVERTEDEMVLELRAAIGLTRRGSQVEAVLRNVVRRN